MSKYEKYILAMFEFGIDACLEFWSVPESERQKKKEYFESEHRRISVKNTINKLNA